MVKNRKAIAEGMYDLEHALEVSWNADANAQSEFQRRFEAMNMEWGAEKEKEKEGIAQMDIDEKELVAGSQKEGDEDVEMGDEAEDAEGEVDGGGFTAVNRG